MAREERSPPGDEASPDGEPVGDADGASETGNAGDAHSVDVDVPDMDCASCASKVEAGVGDVDGVEDVETRPASGSVTATYDPGRASADDVTAGVEAAGYEVASRSVETVTFDVPEMDCASCASKIESALDARDGIRTRETRPTAGTVRVEYDTTETDATELESAIEAAGYAVIGNDTTDAEDVEADGNTDDSVWASRRAKKTYLGAGALAFALLAEFVFGGIGTAGAVLGVEFSIADVAFLAATGAAGQEILRGGYYSAKNRSLDIDFLMSAAIVAAITASVGFGEHLYFEAATLAVLFSVSELLEGYAMDRTRDSLQELVELSPDEAVVKRDGETETVLVEDLAVGDVVVVKPGEKVPADGVVVDGESAIDESPVTGESVPVDKTVGDDVYAGTINAEGYVEVEVTAPASESTLSKIVELVENAEANQTEREQFVERFSAYYTPVMVALAIAVATIPPLALGLSWTTWFVNGITMLVLACPCAFVISTPVSVVSGVTSAARNGVLVKGGNHLEAMGGVDAVAVDKTGTLTKGELTVTDVVALGDRTEADVLECARGLESKSEHPIADAIVEHADGRVATAPGGQPTDAVAVEAAGSGGSADSETPAGAPSAGASDFESVTGKGVKGALHGDAHYAGKPAWFDDLGFELGHAHVVPADADAATAESDAAGVPSEVRDRCERQGCLNLAEDTIPRLQNEGKTVVLVGTDDDLEGLVAVADEIRPGAREAVAALQTFGLEVVMLTGDNERTAGAVAGTVGVDEYRAGLLPEEKVDAVEDLDARYDGGVAMVGDGVNDAPALATATVGVAMGAAGTDTAIETADIALMGDDVGKLPYLYDLSHQANGVIRQNVYASLAVKAILAVGVPLGYVSVALAVLAGDAGMTVGVTGNALRLGRIRPDHQSRGGSDELSQR